IPVIACIGNHDYNGGSPGRDKAGLFNTYFGVGRYEDKPWFGGVYEEKDGVGQSENLYILPEIGGEKWLIVSLEFGPRNDVMDWCSAVVSNYPDRRLVIITHSYMFM